MDSGATDPAKKIAQMTNDHHKPEHQRPGSEAAPSAHGAASQTPPMDDALVEKVARAIDNTDVGYTIQLTRLVDDEATYTLTFSDGRQTRTFSEARDARAEAEAALSSARARAAIQAVQEAQWRPIETAPRDGTFILVALTGREDGAEVVEAYWPKDADDWWLASTSPGDWIGDAIHEVMHGTITHWMPLPSFPKEGDNG